MIVEVSGSCRECRGLLGDRSLVRRPALPAASPFPRFDPRGILSFLLPLLLDRHAYLSLVKQTHALIGSPAAMSKMLADCEVLYIPVFLARAKMVKASYFEGGIRCSRQSNGTPDITLANG